MSENETILKQETRVKQWDTETPPFNHGSAEDGNLILTNKKLLYVSKEGKSKTAVFSLRSAPDNIAVEKTISQTEVNDLIKYEGTYFVPLQEITRLETSRKMNAPYLRVNNCSSVQKPVHSFFFLRIWTRSASGGTILTTQDWANAINSAIETARSSSIASTTYPSQMVPHANDTAKSVATAASTCPFCGGPLSYIQQYQRWYCYIDKKYI